MLDTLKKTVYTAIGVTMTVHANTLHVANRVVARVKSSEADGKRIVGEMKTHLDSAKCTVEKLVLSQVDRILDKMSIATRYDLESLEKRIDAVEVNMQADRTVA